MRSRPPLRGYALPWEGRAPRDLIPEPELPLHLLWDVLLLRVAEGPNLVTLNPATGQVPQVRVLILRARLTLVGQKAQDRSLGTPVMRQVARMLFPSMGVQSQRSIFGYVFDSYHNYA